MNDGDLGVGVVKMQRLRHAYTEALMDLESAKWLIEVDQMLVDIMCTVEQMTVESAAIKAHRAFLDECLRLRSAKWPCGIKDMPKGCA